MDNIREKCEGCGMCCRAIFLPVTHEELVRDSTSMRNPYTKLPEYTGDHANDSDPAFVLANFYPLNREEVLRRNPHIQTWRSSIEEAGEDFDQILEKNFYGCVNLDEETGRCKIHDNLPHVCSGYPWYEREPSEYHLFYAEDCYYKRDLFQKT